MWNEFNVRENMDSNEIRDKFDDINRNDEDISFDDCYCSMTELCRQAMKFMPPDMRGMQRK
jgi:hypothetical protein